MHENFLIPVISIKPPLVGYLERNDIFNFDKMVLGYVKTVMDSPHLFLKQSSQIDKFYRSRDCAKRQLLAQVRQNRGFILDSGYRAEESSEEAFSESTTNAFDFDPLQLRICRWWTSHMVA